MQRPQEPFQRVDVEVAKQLIDEGKVRVIDVREPDEWQAGHIPVADHIPLGQIVNQPLTALEGDVSQPLLFVCAVGGRSAVACEVAAAMGYTELYNLEGGTVAWARGGLPVNTGT
ncbi:MAG: rhodanese-like domain-containing protein [Chloroflexi bacterium]|nr:rhodanese-like domain-containing protein [Chloroflexota bacterium]